MRKIDHMEVSDGDTIIVSSKNCPLTEAYNKEKQVQFGVCCCRVQGQGQDFICPAFYKAVLHNNKLNIDCRR